MGEFWKHFEYGPVTDPSEFDFYNEPDPSTFPDIKFGKLDRNGWTVSTTIPYVKDGSTGKPEDILDGSGSTFLSLYKPGKGTNTAKITPGLTIDMQTQNSFTYFTWQHRTNNTATGLRLQEVSIYGSNTGQDNDFTLIKANITINTGNNNEQKFELGKIPYLPLH